MDRRCPLDAKHRAGTIVEMRGFTGEMEDLRGSSYQRFNPNGQTAHLQEWMPEEDAWLASTLSGQMFYAKEDNFCLVDRVHQLPNADLVVGPYGRQDLVEDTISENLMAKGFCVVHMMSAQPDATAAINDVKKLEFSRFPADYEPYYLGVDSAAKKCMVNLKDDKLDLRGSQLAQRDSCLSMVGHTLTEPLMTTLGIDVAERSDLLIRETFRDEDEEFDFQMPGEFTHEEFQDFMSFAKRRRVCLLQVLGPLTGRLTLMPAAENDGDEIEIEASPGMMVVFLTERFKYSFTCMEGATITMQTWLLSPQAQYDISSVSDEIVSKVRFTNAGPALPTGEQVVCRSFCVDFGGSCDSKSKYWMMVNKAAVDCAQVMPVSRWDVDQYCILTDMSTAMSQFKSYTQHMGLAEGIELFDNHFFGISKNEAAAMDPMQRKVLEVGYIAIAESGFTLKELARSPAHVGVFTGFSGEEWASVEHAPDCGCGGATAILANRVNYCFNLKGPSMGVDTACSAGLVATHAARLALVNKFDPLDGVLCGGVQLCISPFVFCAMCSGTMMSFKGRSFSFDVSADGYMRGEGCMMGYWATEVYDPSKGTQMCMMHASAANQDGRSASLTAPNGPAQEMCARTAMREAGFSFGEVTTLECHGTGTALGDPIEVGSTRRCHTTPTRRDLPLCLSSSKSNMGHLEGGAGAGGLAKIVLQCYWSESSPNIHLRERNPHLDVTGFPVLFMSEGLATQYTSSRCAVNSFGFGGTNGHAICYGRNLMAARSVSNIGGKTSLLKLMREAPKSDPYMMGADPETWEPNGMPIEEAHSAKSYDIEVADDGSVLWREVLKLPRNTAGPYFISGSFNDWRTKQMRESPTTPGLYSINIMIGASGRELFQLLQDERGSEIFHPETAKCQKRTARVSGPSPPSDNREEDSWQIVGHPGAKFRIEFLRTKNSTAVSWRRLGK